MARHPHLRQISGPGRQNRPGNFPSVEWPAGSGQNERVIDGSKGSGAFVGRDGPRVRIRAAFRESLTGTARLVLVSGEAGIGKTALVAEAVREAAGAGATTAWGTCWDADRAPGYWPWAQVVRQMVDRAEAEILDSTSDEDRADLARLVPDLGGGAPATVDALPSPAPRSSTFMTGMNSTVALSSWNRALRWGMSEGSARSKNT